MNQNIFFQGLIILLVVWVLRDRVPYIGNLPGDIYLQLGSLQVFLPITSGILLGIAWSVLRGNH